MEILKNKGLSIETARECAKIMAKAQSASRNNKMSEIADAITRYISQGLWVMMSDSDARSHNVSSDIIESCFDIYKSRRSPDKMCGLTSIILTVPLQQYTNDENAWNGLDIKKLFTNTTITQVRKWKETTLPNSPNKKFAA